MSLKTEYANCYNEDDFTERAGTLHELTVTITLCEYRNLIIETARMEAVNERLSAKNTELEEKCKKLSEALAACKMPEWIESIGRALCGEDDKEEGEEAEHEH